MRGLDRPRLGNVMHWMQEVEYSACLRTTRASGLYSLP